MVGCEVKVSLVNRRPLHIRGEVVGVSEHSVGKFLIKVVVAWQHDEFGAELAGLPRGHGRINPKLAGFVGCGSNDAPAFTANRDGFAPQPGVGSLFDGREESIGVQMHNASGHWKSFGFPSLQLTQCITGKATKLGRNVGTFGGHGSVRFSN